jgi:hypothetical protein
MALSTPDNPRYLTDAARSISERHRWENEFRSVLTAALATEPAALTAASLPARLVAKATSMLSAIGDLPGWASEFIRRRQFSDEWVTVLSPQATAAEVADALAPTLATAAYAQHVLTLLAARGIANKQWVTRRDDKVRHSHHLADRQTVPLSRPFVVGGALMQHPADSRTAPIAQWINDRCVIIGRP